jgi:hypothetical protein
MRGAGAAGATVRAGETGGRRTVRFAATLAAAALLCGGPACDPSRTGAVDTAACARNCATLASTCPGFDGASCDAACDAEDMGRLSCIEDLVQKGRGDCPDFVACFPLAADASGGQDTAAGGDLPGEEGV